MEKRYALRDDQWERLRRMNLPGDSGHVGVTAQDNRLFVDAVLYRFRAGIPWRDLPARFGDWHRAYVRFNRWSEEGAGGGFLRRWPNDFLVGAGRPERSRARQWTLGDVMNSLVAAGLTLAHFEELPDVFWGEFPALPEALVRSLPHTYSLLMRKAGG